MLNTRLSLISALIFFGTACQRDSGDSKLPVVDQAALPRIVEPREFLNEPQQAVEKPPETDAEIARRIAGYSEEQAAQRTRELVQSLGYPHNPSLEQAVRVAVELDLIATRHPALLEVAHAWYNIHRLLPVLAGRRLRIAEDLLANTTSYLVRPVLYYAVTTGNYSLGHTTQSLSFYNDFRVEFSTSRFFEWISPADLELVQQAVSGIHDIEISDLSADERLWRMGKLHYDTLGVHWNRVEVGYDTTLPFSLFNDLIRDYPQSPWADNAEYMILSHEEALSHEGGDNSYNLEAIREYRNLIAKYPDSELIPEIHLQIGSLYFESAYAYQAIVFDYNDHKTALQQAVDQYSMIMTAFPATDEAKKAAQQLKRLHDFLDHVAWALRLEASPKEFKIGDPIQITVRAKNLQDKTAVLKAPHSNGRPLFPLEVYFEPANTRARGGTAAFTLKPGLKKRSESSEVSANSSVSTVVEPKKFCLQKNRRGWEEGAFLFDEPGTYHITAYLSVNDLPDVKSNTIEIRVTN